MANHILQRRGSRAKPARNVYDIVVAGGTPSSPRKRRIFIRRLSLAKDGHNKVVTLKV